MTFDQLWNTVNVADAYPTFKDHLPIKEFQISLIKNEMLFDSTWQRFMEQCPHTVQEWLEINAITNRSVFDCDIDTGLMIIGFSCRSRRVVLADTYCTAHGSNMFNKHISFDELVALVIEHSTDIDNYCFNRETIPQLGK